jgi:MinD-like ATPase involved in chromosome partitioning or flagellar assembly
LPRQAKGDQQVDLPTYTSIWRIEKRLYKLYDFRLPMPLPIGQVTVFAAIAVPYVVLLTVLGLPFNHTLIWLYILPPGLATWLVTRPVLESKRLPELIKSQLRYIAEPRILCRMAPLAERDVVLVTGRVWRPRAGRRDADALAEPAPGVIEPDAEFAGAPAEAAGPMRRGPLPPNRSRERAQSGWPSRQPAPGWPAAVTPPRIAAAPETWPAGTTAAVQPAGHPAGRAPVAGHARAAAPAQRTEFRLVASGGAAQAGPPSRAAAGPAGPPAPGQAPSAMPAEPESATTDPPGHAVRQEPGAAVAEGAEDAPARPRQPADPTPASAPSPPEASPGPPAREPAGPQRPVVTVVGAGAATTAPPSVERALAGPSARRGDLRAGRVAVVPGGHRPGKPDLLQRDRARVRLPLDVRPRIVMLGCTVGAGQTMTTLLTGEVLASLRPDQVAVMDLNPGSGSLARRAEGRPALSQAALTGRSRLVVIGPRTSAGGNSAAAGQPRDPAIDAITFDAATDRYELVLADPATVAVPKLLGVADQLVLVAPASAAAPGAIAMTLEWLEAHGQAPLADGSIMVLNGVSRRSAAAVEQAERVCAGRCRAIVRIPWDDQLQGQVAKRPLPGGPSAQLRQHWTGVLSPATAAAYTALAGVLVASLSEQDQQDASSQEPAHAGQVPR